ncbi:hypothetical protein N9226_00640 [bacterium]|nr:hypothetical protein [bacterium]MDB4538613.1 hypothetical protein [bacterium]
MRSDQPGNLSGPSSTGSGSAAEIFWSPLLPALEREAQHRGGIIKIISPFAKTEPVLRLLSHNAPETRAAVLCRWSASDLASGIADLELFQALQELGIPLFIHPEIHLKLYVFADRHALQGSGNATGSGLGLRGSQVEVASISNLTEFDEQQIRRLFSNATRVTDSIHDDLLEYQRAHQTPAAALPPLPQSALPLQPTGAVAGQMKLDWLPMSWSPLELAQLIGWAPHLSPMQEIVLRNDLEVLGQDLSFAADPVGVAGERFLALPLIQALVEPLRDRGRAQFGVLRNWLLDLAVDSAEIPRPQVDQAVSRVRSWLAASSPSVEISQPNHTEMTFWHSPLQDESSTTSK